MPGGGGLGFYWCIPSAFILEMENGRKSRLVLVYGGGVILWVYGFCCFKLCCVKAVYKVSTITINLSTGTLWGRRAGERCFYKAAEYTLH